VPAQSAAPPVLQEWLLVVELTPRNRQELSDYRPPRGLGKNGFSGAPLVKRLFASVRQRASC
jgi:hypothetical protein